MIENLYILIIHYTPLLQFLGMLSTLAIISILLSWLFRLTYPDDEEY